MFCKSVFCHKLLSWGGVKCEEHRLSVIVIGSFVVFMILGGGIGSGLKLFKFAMDYIEGGKLVAVIPDEPEYIPAAVIDSAPKPNRYIEKNEEEESGCKLANGEWNLWLGDMSRDVRDENHFSLPLTSNQGLFKYSQKYDGDWICDFAFVPRGDKVVNYVISFDGLYQIVIGDNDFWTVSLRASDTVDGALKPVSEERTQLERPRLLSTIKPGSTVKATLKQGFRDEDVYEVEVTIEYNHDTSYEVDTGPEAFKWRFKPSPTLDLKPMELSVGLIRAPGDESHIGASFLSPNPDFVQNTDGSVKNTAEQI